MLLLTFFFDLFLPIAPWPWGQLSFQQKLVRGVSPGKKRWLVRRADNLTTFMCRFSRYSESLNLLKV